MARAWLLYGKPGTLKTTFAGNGPGRKWWAEFDMGSFNRARIEEPELIDVHKYYPPLAAMLDFGRLMKDSKGEVLPHNQRQAIGYMDTLDRFGSELLGELESIRIGQSETKRVIYDTESLLWSMCENARDEEVRLAKVSDTRLGQLRFTEPNRWMRGFIMSPKSVDVDLFLIAHEETPYGKDYVQASGFKEAEGAMDVVLRFTVEGATPWAEITKTAGADLSLKGSRVSWPTVEKIEGLLDGSYRQKIKASGLGLPETADEIVTLGSKL